MRIFLTSERFSKCERFWRWGFLELCLSPLIGTYLYSQDYRITWWVCPLKVLTGIPCPTCGMTRSFIAVIRGNWIEVFSPHLFYPPLFITLGTSVIFYLIELLFNRSLNLLFLGSRKLHLAVFLLGCSYYAIRLAYWQMTGELSFAFSQPPVSQLW